MKEIIVTVGLPRSGKTTWAREQGYPIVNPDSIRLSLHGKRFELLAEDMVWSIVFIMIRSLLLAGHDKVIVDGTHITIKRRREYLNRFEDCKVIFHVMTTSKEDCILRAKKSNDEEIIPIIEKMANQYEQLSIAEVDK